MTFASAFAMFALVARAHRGAAALADSRRPCLPCLCVVARRGARAISGRSASVASLEAEAPVLEVSLAGQRRRIAHGAF